MVLLLSLLACNTERHIPDGDPTVETPEVAPDVTLASIPAGAKPMATRIDRAAEPPASVAKRSGKAPGGTLITRDCYGRGEDEGLTMSTGGLGSSGRGYGGGGSAPSPSPMRPSPSPMGPPPAAAPPAAEPPRSRAMEESKGAARSQKEGAPKAELAAAPSRKPSMADAPTDAAADEAPPASRPSPPPPPLTPPYQDKDTTLRSDVRPELAMAEEEARKPMPTYDWGATVYLSNDDSMSLASAQRLLWAVDQGRGFTPAQVRPHELLNYFSFDTAPVQDGLFSVLGSAAREGDTLSVALAVQGATPPRQPLDLTLVIDRSGSMSAEGRMAYVRRGLTAMVDQLQDGDRVDLVLFDSDVCSPIENFVVGRDDASKLRREIDRMEPRGATDLDGGLREGFRVQTARDQADVHGRNRRVLLLTDAMLNTGNVDEDLVSEVGKRFETDGIRVTGVGVGRDFNDTMLNKLTEKGKGAYVFLGSEAVVDRVFGGGFDALVQTIAHDVQFSIDLPDSLAMEKFYGEESSTVASDVQPIHYYAGTSQVFLQDLKIKEGGPKSSDPVVFTIKYRDAVSGEPGTQTFATTVGALLDGDSHNLVKAQALMAWTDLLAERALGDRNCTSLRDYRSAASKVTGDAEIGYVSTLTGKLCGVDMSQTVAATGVSFKVRVDADLPIPEVKLACGGATFRDALAPGDNIAQFADVPAGTCDLVLSGQVPMRAAVKVPATGGDVRCLVRGGRVDCG